MPGQVENTLNKRIDGYLLDVKEQGQCFAPDKQHADASVDKFSLDATICFSVENLMRIPKNVLNSHIAGLWFHEIAHMNGYDEAMAVSVQEMIVTIYPLLVPDYRNAISTEFRSVQSDLIRPLRQLNGAIGSASNLPDNFLPINFSAVEESARNLSFKLEKYDSLKVCSLDLYDNNHQDLQAKASLVQFGARHTYDLHLKGTLPKDLFVKMAKVNLMRGHVFTAGSCDFSSVDICVGNIYASAVTEDYIKEAMFQLGSLFVRPSLVSFATGELQLQSTESFILSMTLSSSYASLVMAGYQIERLLGALEKLSSGCASSIEYDVARVKQMQKAAAEATLEIENLKKIAIPARIYNNSQLADLDKHIIENYQFHDIEFSNLVHDWVRSNGATPAINFDKTQAQQYLDAAWKVLEKVNSIPTLEDRFRSYLDAS